MARTNNYEGDCAVCGALVAPQAGYAEPPAANGRRWVIKCKDCAGVREDAKATVQVTMAGTDVTFKPLGFFGSDLFAAYRSACDGARYEGAKGNVAPVSSAARMLAALTAAGFVLSMHQDVAATVRAHQDAVRSIVAETDERTAQIDAELKARGLALYAFQGPGIRWLAALNAALLADDMGLGKTLQTILALPEGAPVVVVAPAIAKGVWRREVAKWRPEFRVTVLSGRHSFRYPQPGEIIVTNYELLPGEALAIESRAQRCTQEAADCPTRPSLVCITTEAPKRGTYRVRGQVRCSYVDAVTCNAYRLRTTACQTRAPMTDTVLVADEAHLLKTPKSTRAQRFQRLSAAARQNGGKVWLLTATPILNQPREIWNIFDSAGIAYECFGGWKNFARIFQGTKNGFGGWTWGTPESEEVAARLSRVMLRRVKSQVLKDLPLKRWVSIDVDLDDATKALCDEALGGVADLEAVMEAIEEGKTLDFHTMSKARAALAMAKIPAMLEVVESYEEQGEPLVVFSAHRAPIDLLGKRAGWAAISGDTSAERRTEIEAAFQAGKLKGVACTIKAGGVAITLTRAAHELFVDKEWTPSLNDQAQDRCYRIGQTRGVLVTTLVGDHPLDARVDELLAEKSRIITASVEAATTTTAPAIELPVVDFAAIEALAQEEAKASAKVKEAAAARAKAFEGKAPPVAPASGPRIRIPAPSPDRRGARTPQEVWANQALVTLAGLDPDHAGERNDVGFNGTDTKRGHRYARIAGAVGLTSDEWKDAVKRCRKYWRQVGKCPEPETAPAMDADVAA